MDQIKATETIKLSNGEIIEIFDKSRMIAQDTWIVSMIFRINIDLKEKNFNTLKTITDNQIKERFGDSIVYEVKHERNFIKENEKDKVYSDIKDSFLNTNLKYLSHPEFALKYVVKKYNEKKRY